MKTITETVGHGLNSLTIQGQELQKLQYHIEKVEGQDVEKIAKVIAFYKQIRVDLFPMLDPHLLPNDMALFDENYLNRPDAAFFIALSDGGEILGTIAYLPYDDRFTHLIGSKTGVKSTELVRCFIDAKYRRQGIGSKLFTAAVKSIQDSGYDNIYLHTHYFLPGGVEFWKAKGFFETLKEMESADYPTLHMSMDV